MIFRPSKLVTTCILGTYVLWSMLGWPLHAWADGHGRFHSHAGCSDHRECQDHGACSDQDADDPSQQGSDHDAESHRERIHGRASECCHEHAARPEPAAHCPPDSAPTTVHAAPSHCDADKAAPPETQWGSGDHECSICQKFWSISQAGFDCPCLSFALAPASSPCNPLPERAVASSLLLAYCSRGPPALAL